MTEFEQRVYEALEVAAEKAGDYESPCGSTVLALAPRVADAIEATASLAAAGLRSPMHEMAIADAKIAALAALRGDP